MEQDSESRQNFLQTIQQLRDQEELTPGKVAEIQPESRLNIVFDIDHTLIFAIEKRMYPNIMEKVKEQGFKDIRPITVGGTYEMWLVVRYGVFEMLDYLKTFCNFYVYSHGLHEYIGEILKSLDPDEVYFKDRKNTVIAPRDSQEQQKLLHNHKRFSDFRDPQDPSKPLFSETDLQKTLIIDDQYCAIHDKEHLLMSKKFLQFAEQTPYAQPQRKLQWNNYQFPKGSEHVILQGDLTKAHQELNNIGDQNQLYYICNLITRCYLAKTVLSPHIGINVILQEYKKSIFKGFKFSFRDYLSIGLPEQNAMTSGELDSAAQMRAVCAELIKELGGTESQANMQATHIVIHQAEAPQERLQKYRPDQKVVNFRYLTECYFQMVRLKHDDTTYGIKFQIKGITR